MLVHSRYGDLLRKTRNERGLSQLGLASVAGVSTRHLSFLETGRSAPSREMVEHLCNALAVPLRDRNPMLVAAGYAPAYRTTAFDAPELSGVREVLRRWIDAQDPYPAIVLDRDHEIVMTSSAANRFFGLVFGGPIPAHLGKNLAMLVFHPDGLRRAMHNFDVVASSLVRRMRREATSAHEAARLEATVGTYLRDVNLDAVDSSDAPIIAIEWDLAGERLSTVSTIATFGSAADVTLTELRIETVLPADEASARLMRKLSRLGSD